jgi:exodeoxyribonuclease VII small subunit
MTKKQPTFEENLDAVEAAIRKLEGGDIALEDSIDVYAEAMARLKACHAVLDKAEKRLEIVRRSVEGGASAAPAATDDDGVKPR